MYVGDVAEPPFPSVSIPTEIQEGNAKKDLTAVRSPRFSLPSSRNHNIVVLRTYLARSSFFFFFFLLFAVVPHGMRIKSDAAPNWRRRFDFLLSSPLVTRLKMHSGEKLRFFFFFHPHASSAVNGDCSVRDGGCLRKWLEFRFSPRGSILREGFFSMVPPLYSFFPQPF